MIQRLQSKGIRNEWEKSVRRIRHVLKKKKKKDEVSTSGKTCVTKRFFDFFGGYTWPRVFLTVSTTNSNLGSFVTASLISEPKGGFLPAS